ncbi:hypothetical protein [Mycoplasma sp. 4404]|uniref:hypothetical protein n=1 Tax=Mycoplasma sp. 4404 TaxID=3108530 RepID=UPI002B1E7919|nr:hypothetical protein [Mycoplasma sp. 4404]MEA4162628.1 hypothetical protein [Mycoplasma sp. 4404]
MRLKHLAIFGSLVIAPLITFSLTSACEKKDEPKDPKPIDSQPTTEPITPKDPEPISPTPEPSKPVSKQYEYGNFNWEYKPDGFEATTQNTGENFLYHLNLPLILWKYKQQSGGAYDFVPYMMSQPENRRIYAAVQFPEFTDSSTRYKWLEFIEKLEDSVYLYSSHLTKLSKWFTDETKSLEEQLENVVLFKGGDYNKFDWIPEAVLNNIDWDNDWLFKTKDPEQMIPYGGVELTEDKKTASYIPDEYKEKYKDTLIYPFYSPEEVPNLYTAKIWEKLYDLHRLFKALSVLKPNKSERNKEERYDMYFHSPYGHIYSYLDRDVYENGEVVYHTTDKYAPYTLSKSEAVKIIDEWFNTEHVYDKETGATTTYKEMFNIRYSTIAKEETSVESTADNSN